MFDTEGVSVVRPTIIDIWKTISVELEDMWIITNIEWDKKYENFFDRDVVKGISDLKTTFFLENPLKNFGIEFFDQINKHALSPPKLQLV